MLDYYKLPRPLQRKIEKFVSDQVEKDFKEMGIKPTDRQISEARLRKIDRCLIVEEGGALKCYDLDNAPNIYL